MDCFQEFWDKKHDELEATEFSDVQRNYIFDACKEAWDNSRKFSEGNSKVKVSGIDFEKKTVDYSIKANNGRTTIEQTLRLRRASGLWEAEMGMSGFGYTDTAHEAAMKYSSWLGRLAAAIPIGNFMSMSIEDV